VKKRLITCVLAVLLLLSLVPAVQAQAAGADFTISDQGIDIIKSWEGFRAKPHWDYSQYTVGYGTRVPDGKLEEYNANGISREEAEALLRSTLETTGKRVNSFLDKFNIKATQGMFDMLVSISFNCGSAWLYETSTLKNAIVEGWTGNDLLFAVGQWSTAGGSTLPALVRRRLCEVNMYVNGIYSTTVPSNYCYVRFDPNGGKCEIKTQCYDSNTPAAIRAVPTYEGYTFEGWYTDATGGEKVTVLDASVRNYMLYAHWSAGNNDAKPEEPSDITGTSVSYDRVISTELLHSFVQPVSGALVYSAHKQGDTVKITREYRDNGGITWGKVKDGGWINLGYTKQIGEPDTEKIESVTITVTGTDVNIRRGPGTGYATSGRANKGDKLTITETAVADGHTWGKSTKGWIALTYTNYSTLSQEEDNKTEEPTTPPATEPTTPPATEEPTTPPATEEPTTPPATEEPTTPPAEPEKTTGKVKLTSGVLNVRQGPSTGYPVVGSLKNGEKVEILETKTVGAMQWGRITKGWVSMSYIVLDKQETDQDQKPEEDQPDNNKPDDNKPAQTIQGKVSITSGVLNVRSGAGTNYAVVSTLKANQTVTITEKKTVSGRVWGKTSKGWVCMDYISLTNEENKTEVVNGTVNSGNAYLRVRSAPSTDASIAAHLANGTKIQILEKKTVSGVQWGRIDKGWVDMRYVVLDGEKAPEQTQKPEQTAISGTVKLTSGVLNVRSAAGTGNKIVGYLKNGEKVTILETKMVGTTQWGRITSGWISMDYVKKA